jgi:hypothetical protein
MAGLFLCGQRIFNSRNGGVWKKITAQRYRQHWDTH